MWNTQKPASLSKFQAAPQSVFDISAGHSPSLLGASIVENLFLKGFCTIDLGLESSLAEQAVKSVDAIWDADRFEPTPPVLHDGLLGEQGSSQIACLKSSDDVGGDSEALQHLDGLITDIGAVIAPLVPQLDFDIEDRTIGLLHQTGALKPGSNTSLTDLEAQKWLTQLWWQRILVLIFLGPDEGNLELVPFDDEESNSHDFTTKPGMMVIMRADELARYHTSKGRSITLSATFMQPVSQPKPRTCPCVEHILDLIMQRMKIHTAEDSLGDTAVPREFQRMAHHLFHKGPRTSVISCPGRFPTTWDCDAWFSSLTAGPDVMERIPSMRWDHEVNKGNFDPHPECWRWGLTHIQHGAFCEGLELFDNRFFNLSVNESRGMDPGQRLLLEVAYEGLWNGGLRKKDILNSATSVYVGHTSAEWNWAERSEESRASPGSGSVMCIYSNRVNYALGLKGPSISVDQEGASAVTAVHLCCVSVMDVWSNGEKKGGAICGHGIGLGSYLILANRALCLQTAAGCLAAVGRCLTFDASASGIGRSEGVSGCIVKPLAKYVDGEPVIHEKGWPPQGVLASTGTNCSGMAANIKAPHGPAIQEIIGNALDEARISPLDVDSAEVHGEGRLMCDVIDIGTALFALRASPEGTGMQEMPELVMGSVKSNVGHAKENAGAFGLIKAIMASQVAAAIPNCHLRVMNPNLEARGLEDLVLINSEPLLSSASASFTNVTAHGFGGSNSNAIVWNTTELHNKVVKQPPPLDRQPFVFWPGGGGELEDEATDCQAYHIIGSWTSWEEPEPMEPEGDGIFGYTVTLGENGFEQFQILLDGDDQRILHPGQPWGLKNSHVYGPNESWESASNTWAIDGRKQLALNAPREGVRALMYEGFDSVPSGVLVDTTDTAQPGEAFRVRLKIAGKWRVVTWDKIGPINPDHGPARSDGNYFLSGDFNGWTFDPMRPSYNDFGVHTAEVRLFEAGGEFQVVRDRSWDQVFYPLNAQADSDSRVLGPEGNSEGRHWCFQGKPGDVFQVKFTREREDGQDRKKLTWTRTQSEVVTTVEMAERGQARFFIIGSWDDWSSSQPMSWDGSAYSFRLRIGPQGHESFQILLSGKWDRRLYPSKQHASPSAAHVIMGPSEDALMVWTVSGGEVEPGSIFSVRFWVQNGEYKRLTWEKVR